MSMNARAGLVIIAAPLVQTPPEVTLANAGTDTQEMGSNAQVILISRNIWSVIRRTHCTLYSMDSALYIMYCTYCTAEVGDLLLASQMWLFC